MQEQSRHEREWEHWPGRGQQDEGIRRRLRALFAATDGEDADAVELMISERSRELEVQAERLQATVAGLERREEQAARLRAAVEEMLRAGSAELDERHAQLSALATDIAAREERLLAQEREVALRRQELGAVELRRAAVERREHTASERERALEAAAAEVRRRESDLTDAERALAERTAAVAARSPEEPKLSVTAHVLFVAGGPYALLGRDGPPPAVGAPVEIDGVDYVVTRVGGPVLPDDLRPCVYVEPARAGELTGD